jgi:hypothetical protein
VNYERAQEHWITHGKKEGRTIPTIINRKNRQKNIETSNKDLNIKYPLKTEQGQLCLTKGEHRLTKGELRLTKGELRLTKGELRSTKGEHRLTKGEHRLTKGELRLTGENNIKNEEIITGVNNNIKNEDPVRKDNNIKTEESTKKEEIIKTDTEPITGDNNLKTEESTKKEEIIKTDAERIRLYTFRKKKDIKILPLKISYINFWFTNLDNISELDNWLFLFIKNNIYPHCQIVKPNEDPDILFCSCFGRLTDIIKTKAKIKIFFYGENIEYHKKFREYNDFNNLKNYVDLIVGFYYSNRALKRIRLPLWITFYPFYNFKDPTNNIITFLSESYKKNIESIEKRSPSIKAEQEQHSQNNEMNKNKTGASLVARFDLLNIRKMIYTEVSKYTKVLCPGKLFNNTNPIGLDFNDKINFIKTTIFNICPENSRTNGYCTEKIFHSLEAGCIPIYWGSKPEPYILNEKCYFLIDEKLNKQKIQEDIKYLIKNYKEYIVDNIFKDNAKFEIERMYYELENGIRELIKLKIQDFNEYIYK